MFDLSDVVNITCIVRYGIEINIHTYIQMPKWDRMFPFQPVTVCAALLSLSKCGTLGGARGGGGVGGGGGGGKGGLQKKKFWDKKTDTLAKKQW